MKGWSKDCLGDVAELCLGKMLDQNKNRGELLPYLANINVRWGSFDLAELRQMRFEPSEAERYMVKYGDIVMCEGGEPGRCALWKDEMPGMMIQKALHRIRANKKVNNVFLYYQLYLNGRKGLFSALFTGSTIKHLPRQKLEKVEIKYPTLPMQQRIVDIISPYDDLIENNRRRIALLEESARLLYREWFVRLRFPGHEHVKVVDGVPEGWERKPLGEFCSFLKRGIAPKYDDDSPGLVINQKCIRDGRVDINLARHQSKEVKADRLVQVGDVLVNSTGTGTLGRVAQVKAPIENCTVDSHVTIVRPISGMPTHFFGQSVMALEPIFTFMGKGATNQTELSPSAIGTVEILVPGTSIGKQFEMFAQPVFEQVTNLTTQIERLRAARDLLLPKLMNGELAV